MSFALCFPGTFGAARPELDHGDRRCGEGLTPGCNWPSRLERLLPYNPKLQTHSLQTRIAGTYNAHPRYKQATVQLSTFSSGVPSGRLKEISVCVPAVVVEERACPVRSTEYEVDPLRCSADGEHVPHCSSCSPAQKGLQVREATQQIIPTPAPEP